MRSPGAARRRDLAILLLVTLVATAPFLSQAFHLDDEVYLRVARELVQSPTGVGLRPQPLFGVPAPLVDHTRHPPFTILVLALLTWLLGGASEIPFHLAYSGFASPTDSYWARPTPPRRPVRCCRSASAPSRSTGDCCLLPCALAAT